MWPQTFSARLAAWTSLRDNVANLPTEQCLLTVNQWWFESPWTTYYLHWDDREFWPDPWQLLQDNIYCDLARGLGIMYTLAMLERNDIEDAKLVEVGADNLVLVAREKYALNWEADSIVNICPDTLTARRCVTRPDVIKRIA